MSESVFSPNYDSEIQPKAMIVKVGDRRLASCLIAVGIRLRKDPPYVQLRKADKGMDVVFNFLPSDDEGELKTIDLVKAWSRDLEFIKENPLHPFTFAMCAIRNYQDIITHLNNDTPYVAFSTVENGSPATLLVKEGSKKHTASIKRGLKQI